MFERYTERARRVIFFGRYEASQLGDQQIDSQHLLLGLMHEDAALFLSYMPREEIEKIRQAIEEEARARNPKREVPTSVDLPLSSDGKRVLAYAAEEVERAEHKYLGTEHLLLGILKEKSTLAAQLLEKRGLTLDSLRQRFRSGDYYSREKHFDMPAKNSRTADGCIEFIEIETGQRVGIMGMHWNYPLPRATDLILLQPVGDDRQVRYEVLEVVFDYVRQMPSQPYSIQHLKNITVKLRRAEQRPSTFAEST